MLLWRRNAQGALNRAALLGILLSFLVTANIKLFSSVGVINTFRVTLRAGGAGKQKKSGISSRTPQKEWNQFP